MFYEITRIFLNPSVSFVKTVLPYQRRQANLSQRSFAAGRSSTAVCQHISCCSVSSADVSLYMQPRQPSPTACDFPHIPFDVVWCRYLAVTFFTRGYWPCYTDIYLLHVTCGYWPCYTATGHVNTDTGHVNTDTGHVIQILAMLIRILVILYGYWPCSTDTGHVNTDSGHVNTDNVNVNTDTGHVLQILAMLYRYWPC